MAVHIAQVCDSRHVPASAAVYNEKLPEYTFLKNKIADSWRRAIHGDAGGSLDLKLKFEVNANFSGTSDEE